MYVCMYVFMYVCMYVCIIIIYLFYYYYYYYYANVGRVVRCQQNASECIGDFCAATVRISESGGYHIIDTSCVSGSLCISYPRMKVNYTDNGTLQEFLFGCCESEDFCNRNISNLLFPDEYYGDINPIMGSRERKINSSISQPGHDNPQQKSSSPHTLCSVQCNKTQSSQSTPTCTNGVFSFMHVYTTV